MAHFVGEGLALVIATGAATRICRVEDDDAIIDWVSAVRPGEGCIPERTISEADGINVEDVGTTSVESFLHSGLVAVAIVCIVEPIGIQGAGRAGKGE